MTNDDPPGRLTRVRRGVVALLGVALLVLVVYSAARVRTIYTLHAEVVQVRIEIDALRQRQQQSDEAIQEQLNSLERILFGEVITKLDQAPNGPTRVELWQKNRDAELRGRIQTLERRVMRIEAIIQEWR